jgi:hypothetical protein
MGWLEKVFRAGQDPQRVVVPAAANFSKISVNFYQSMWCHILEVKVLSFSQDDRSLDQLLSPLYQKYSVRFEVLTAVAMQNAVLWDGRWCNLIEVERITSIVSVSNTSK